MKHMTYLTAVLLAMIVAAPATAQDVTQTDLQAELRSMVSETTPADRDRAAVQDFLDRGDVADVAESWGIDMEQLHEE